MTRPGAVRMRLGMTERRASLCDALDTLLDTGVVVAGEIRIRVADVDLICVNLELVAGSWDTVQGLKEEP